VGGFAVSPAGPEKRGALNNRLELEQRLGERIQSTPENFALVMVDVDGLTDINDTEGHPAGDEFLDSLQDLLEDMIRHPDRPADPEATPPDGPTMIDSPDELILIHINGDEFCIILGDTQTQDQVNAFIRRIQKDLLDHGIEASMGGVVHENGQTPQDIYELAGKRMDADKDARRLALARTLPLPIEIILLSMGDKLIEASKVTGIPVRRLAAIAVALAKNNPQT
jgi:GGDEF domain-containing protein